MEVQRSALNIEKICMSRLQILETERYGCTKRATSRIRENFMTIANRLGNLKRNEGARA